MKEQITELTHPSMYVWFTKYSSEYKNMLNNIHNNLENGKLEFENNYDFQNELVYIKYPYGDVDYFNISKTNVMFLINSGIKLTQYGFYCYSSKKLLSFKGFPRKIDTKITVCDSHKEQYSVKHKDLDKYKIYLAIWLELFDSVTEEERWEYINEFKDKKNNRSEYSVIPKELLLEFGVL